MNPIFLSLCIFLALYLESVPSFRKFSWTSESQRYYPLIYSDASRILNAAKFSADNEGRRNRYQKSKNIRPRIDPSWLPVSLNWRVYNVEVLLEDDPGKGS